MTLNVLIGNGSWYPIVGTAPVITIPTSLPTGTANTVYTSTQFYASGTAPITWSNTGSLPSGMTFSSSGLLSGTPTATANSSITFTATNAYGSDSRALTLTVSAATNGFAPLITTTNAPASGTVNAAYSSTLTTDVGDTPITWSVTAGSLPAGLTLSSSGVISGTPTVSCAKPVVFKASNAIGSSQAVFLLSIANGAGSIAPTITTDELPGTWNNATQGGGTYSYQLQASGSTPITWSLISGTLPSGLSLSSAGVISGTPVSNSAATITVQATNSAGSIQKSLTFPAVFALTNSGAYCTTGVYPTNWIWTNPVRTAQANPATSGTKRIDQIRGGVVIATYTSLGLAGWPSPQDGYLNPSAGVAFGAFKRFPYNTMMDGDIFEVYPAVYDQESDQPYIGPSFNNSTDYTNGVYYIPKNITIRGITVGGVRPVFKPAAGQNAAYNNLNQSLVYFDTCENVVFENFDIQLGSATAIGKGGIYISGAKNLTLRNIRVSGFKAVQQNGIFAGSGNSGTLRLDNVEMINNGGAGGPEHNAYINASTVDSNFTVHLTNCFSTDVFYGHTFKSRAQTNIAEGCYFMGTRASVPEPQKEAYLFDTPEGGNLVLRNNIFVKDYSGDNSNGASITYFTPGDGRNQSIIIEHNTFVAFTKFYDTLNNPVYPLFLQYPQRLPGSSTFTAINTSIKNNMFVGYCAIGGYIYDYRGVSSVNGQHTDITTSFNPISPTIAASSQIVGTSIYSHTNATPGTRTTAAIGARD